MEHAVRRRSAFSLLRRVIFLCRTWLKTRANALVYRVAGLPTALRAFRRCKQTPAAAFRREYARWYWKPRTVGEVLDLTLALATWPVAFAVIAAVFLWRKGRTVSASAQRPVGQQFLDQVRLYATAGVLPSCYYTYGLYEQPSKRQARGFLLRCETKGGVFHALNGKRAKDLSNLWDKSVFADHCHANGIETLKTLAIIGKGQIIAFHPEEAFRTDLFVKPVKGKGGRGAQRWDYLGDDRYRDSSGRVASREALFKFVLSKSSKRKLLVQPRAENHPDLVPISNGALSTLRVLTCLDEQGRPEMISAMLRMAIKPNSIVDNAHKGGIAAAVDLETGTLGRACDFGLSANWLDRHPTTGAQITGRPLPYWPQLGEFVEHAHSTVTDRVLVGWDVAITPTGILLIEANGSPGLEMMQRVHGRGFIRERLGQLLAHHLVAQREERRLMAA